MHAAFDQRAHGGFNSNLPGFPRCGLICTTRSAHATISSDDLKKLRRERIALLEGFDETGKGLAGRGSAITPCSRVEPTDDGGVSATDFKWVGYYRAAGSTG